jgi:hypothetical protein
MFSEMIGLNWDFKQKLFTALKWEYHALTFVTKYTNNRSMFPESQALTEAKS